MSEIKADCEKCGYRLLSFWKFCPMCGLSTIFENKCPVCGKPVRKQGLVNHIRLTEDEAHREYYKKSKDL